MRELHIFDIGSFVHAGAVNTHSSIDDEPIKEADGYRSVRYMTGGIALILNALAGIPSTTTADCVFCADRNPTIKKLMIPGYKGNRKHPIGIEKQKKIIEIVLENIGYTVLYKDGYEADDFIYSVVKKFKDSYDHMYIYTGDSDLYFLVSDTVTIRPSSSRAKLVTRDNYSDITVGGVHVPYNAITYNKILGGDKSDCIPPLPDDCIQALAGLTTNELFYPNMGDRDFLHTMVKQICPAAAQQVLNVFPLDVDIPEELEQRQDATLLKEWGGLVKANRYKRLEEPSSDSVKKAIEEMRYEHLYDED